jgi:hypothetical protein
MTASMRWICGACGGARRFLQVIDIVDAAVRCGGSAALAVVAYKPLILAVRRFCGGGAAKPPIPPMRYAAPCWRAPLAHEPRKGSRMTGNLELEQRRRRHRARPVPRGGDRPAADRDGPAAAVLGGPMTP